MARATYTDDQIHAALAEGAWADVSKQAKSAWLRQQEEWEAEVRTAEREEREPEPGSRVARVLLAARQLPAAGGAGPDEGTFLARAHTREAVSADDLREHVGGRLLQLLDYEFERLDEMKPGERREFTKMLFAEFKQMTPAAPEVAASGAGLGSTDALVLALVGNNQQVNLNRVA